MNIAPDTIKILLPTGRERSEGALRARRRVGSMEGVRIGLLDNTKLNSERLLRAVASNISASHSGVQVRFWQKSEETGASGPAADQTIAEMAHSVDVALVALGD